MGRRIRWYQAAARERGTDDSFTGAEQRNYAAPLCRIPGSVVASVLIEGRHLTATGLVCGEQARVRVLNRYLHRPGLLAVKLEHHVRTRPRSNGVRDNHCGTPGSSPDYRGRSVVEKD